jgi:integrase
LINEVSIEVAGRVVEERAVTGVSPAARLQHGPNPYYRSRFARISAVLQMKVRDYFVQGRRGWVCLHEKGGKEHEVPSHHNLVRHLDE